MNFIIIFEPIGEHCDYGLGIRQDREASIIALEGFDEASEMPLDSGVRTGVKQGQAEGRAMSSVSLAM